MKKRLTLDLPVPLPVEQLQTLSRQIAMKVGNRDEVEADKAAAVKEFNQRLAHLDADISEVGKQIRTGSTEAGVECETTMDDPAPGFKTTRRLDTGETLGEPQPMEEADRQEELFAPGDVLNLEQLASLPDNRDGEAPIKDTEPEANKGEEPPATPAGWTQQPDNGEPPPEIEPGR